MSTLRLKQFERTCTVRELIMALRAVGNHDALVKIEANRKGDFQDVCRLELTDHGPDFQVVYLCVGSLPLVTMAQRKAEMGL